MAAAVLLRPGSEVAGYIAGGGRTAVLMSGGVDSSVVAELAVRGLGSDAIAVTLAGPSLSVAERERAVRVAASIGIAHATVPVDQLASAEYRANPSNRCYFCRSTEVGAVRRWAEDRGIVQLVDGVHLDDLGEARAGLRALDEAGVRHPLLWAGWRKSDVRAYARSAGLPNWDQPSDACLSSRVTHGSPIDAGLLARIEAAESTILERGFRRVRVRTDGVTARIEVDPVEVPRLLAEPMATEVRTAVEAHGFGSVTLDPLGYRARPGS